MLNYFNNILKLDYTTDSISIILVDNESAKKLAENPEFYKQSKYIDIIYYYTRNAIQSNIIKIMPIPTKDNIADIITKNTTKNMFNLLYPKII